MKKESTSTSPTTTEWNALFVKVTRVHWDALLRFSMSLTGDESEAEDVLQSALLKALRFFEKFVGNNFSAVSIAESEAKLAQPDAQAHLKNWLYKITKHTFLDIRATRKETEPWEDGDFGFSVSPVEPFASEEHSVGATTAVSEAELKKKEERFFAGALDDTWKQRLSQLSPRQRSVLYLASEEYSYKEIASLLAIPIGTVMSTLSRTIDKIKKSSFPHPME